MHILEIPSFFTPYGGEFCLDQAKALKALGHEVRILSNVQLAATIGLKDYLCRPYRRHETVRDGVVVYQSFQRGIPKAVRRNADRWVNIVCSMFEDYLARYGRPDVIHAHCGKWAGYAALLISRKHKIPFVITEHLPKEILATEFQEPLSELWQLPLLRSAYEGAGMVITVSDELVEELACYFGRAYRHVTIPNMIDVDFFPCRGRTERSGRPFVLCCPAVFVPRKGYDVLLAAFARLVQQGLDVRLIVAGQGTDGNSFRELAQANGCDERRLECRGQLDKHGVRAMLYESDALVLATRGESQGLVVLEALSTGIPAISTEAIPQSVRPSSGCRYVPVDDVQALTEEMKYVIQNPAADGRELSAQVRQMASPEAIGRRIADVLADVAVSEIP